MIVTNYNEYYYRLGLGEIDLVDDTIKIALLTSSYTPDYDTHSNFDDLTNEVTGTGYTAGGATLASKTFTKDNTNNRGVFDASDVVWSTSTITARYGVIYKDTGTPATSTLIALLDFEQDEVSAGADFLITWHASGIFAIKVAS